MADKYSTIQQHQPLRVPEGWSRQEKALIVQLDETFDDIYRRFGRLRMEDMSKSFRKQIEDDEGNIAQIALDISGLTTRVGNAEGDISALQVRAGNIEISVANKYDKISGITITTAGIDVSGSQYVKIASGGTFEVDSTNFKISSTDKKMVSGNWTFDNNGLLCDPGALYKFSIVNTSSDMPSSTIGIIYSNETSGSLSSGLMKFVVRSKYGSTNNMPCLVFKGGYEGGAFYPENDNKMELGQSNKPFYKIYVNQAYITGSLHASIIYTDTNSATIGFKKTISGSEANEYITVEMTDSRKLIISDGERIVYKGNSFGGRYSYDTGTVNLNNKTDPTYEWCDTYSSNKPSGLTGDFLLEVIAVNPLDSNPTIMQKITSTTGMYYRVRPSGGSWGSWYKFSCTAV